MLPLTRKHFLKSRMFLAAGMTLLGLTGLIPKPGFGAGNEFLQTSCGITKQSEKKILIAYASMHGSTGRVAEAIAKDLCAAGASVDVRLVGDIKDISPYRAVIVGSAIRSEEWLPEAKEFVVHNRAILKNIPTVYFLTCLTLAKASEETKRKAQSFLNPVMEAVPEVKPVCIGLFAGVLDYSKYTTTIKAVMKYKMWTKGVEEGDYRNWQAIHAWTDQLKSVILSVQGEKHAVN
jgi:menaquinone-dependent protoporphyrinogen oxidase